MKFINKYNNNNFNNKLASLINFDNNINKNITAISRPRRPIKVPSNIPSDDKESKPAFQNDIEEQKPMLINKPSIIEEPNVINEPSIIEEPNVIEEPAKNKLQDQPMSKSDLDKIQPNPNSSSIINPSTTNMPITNPPTNNQHTNNSSTNNQLPKIKPSFRQRLKSLHKQDSQLDQAIPNIQNTSNTDNASKPNDFNFNEPTTLNLNNNTLNKSNTDIPNTNKSIDDKSSTDESKLKTNAIDPFNFTEPNIIETEIKNDANNNNDNDNNNNDKEIKVKLTEQETHGLAELFEESRKSDKQTDQIIQSFDTILNNSDNNNANNNADNNTNNIQQQIADTQKNLYSITDALQKITQKPEEYIIPINDILNNIISEEESSNDVLIKANEEIDKIDNEKLDMQDEQSPASVLLDKGIGAITTDKDQQILTDLQGEIQIPDTRDEINNTIKHTDITQVVETTINNIQDINLVPETIDEAEQNESGQKGSQRQKIKSIKLDTSFESILQKYNNNINANLLKDKINEFTDPEQLKQYILQECDDTNRTILNSDAITNINQLKQAISAIYKIAFDNKSMVQINSAFEYNITNLVNKFLATLYIDMFKQESLIGNRNGMSIGNITAQNVETFISSRLNPNWFYKGEEDKRIYPYFTPLNKKTGNTLYQLINACALKFCIEKFNNEIQYDSTKSLDDLSTEQLFVLKKMPRKRNVKELQGLSSDFTNAAAFNKSNIILEKIDKARTTLGTYINNYSTQLRKLVTYRKNISPDMAEHHRFERMSFRGFSKPLDWYAIERNAMANKPNASAIYHIPQEIEITIQDIQATVTNPKPEIKKSNIKFYTDIYLRYKLTLLYKKYIIPYLLENLNKLNNAYNLLNNYQFTSNIYDQLYKDIQQHPLHFFRISNFFTFTKETIPIEYLDPYTPKNQKLLQSRRATMANRINNRILIRLAMNFNGSLADNDILIQFYQQPYAKYLISLLCGTTCLTGNNRRNFEQEKKSGKDNQYFLNMPKMQKYIKEYLIHHKNQLETLHINIINTAKSLLQNNDKLINILPKINLLQALDQINIINISETTFKDAHNIFNTSAINNSYDFIGYIMWRFSRNGCNRNSEYKYNLRRYILQPLTMEQLNAHILEYIKKYTEKVNTLYIN